MNSDARTATTSQQCCKRIYDRTYWDRTGHQCERKGKVERDGKWYCGTHDPLARKEKRDARDAERRQIFEEQMKVARVKNAAGDMLAALADLTECDAEELLDSTSDVWLRAHAAIAKATGETVTSGEVTKSESVS